MAILRVELPSEMSSDVEFDMLRGEASAAHDSDEAAPVRSGMPAADCWFEAFSVAAIVCR
ncbi:hypothetical protein [Mycobacterium sp. DL99]|uniref:hypothetical protein n=1 Tax=Mycobacterium sp. DL99 TaxID=2528957 RepID=UPI0010816EE8|nr:hypothetical protein [Mycobacterium sp. DL99]